VELHSNLGKSSIVSVAAIDRCLSLMEALSGEADGAALGDLAARLAMPKSAVHRMLATLVARGYVCQDEASQSYRLSLRLAVLAFRYLDASRLPDVAQGVLDRLAHETGEYCRIALLEGERLVWIARAQGATQGLRYEPDMSQEVVLHATATGKAWLATLPENEALRIVCAQGFGTPPGFGKRVVRDVDQLRAQLAETRARGHAVALEEGEPGTAAMAATFRAWDAADAPVVGTVSIAGPLMRFSPKRRQQMVGPLTEAARELSALWPLRARRQHPGNAAAADRPRNRAAARIPSRNRGAAAAAPRTIIVQGRST
jgi:IclR family acetate operon transcriptional repressor